MLEREGGAKHFRAGTQRGQLAMAEESELLLERAVGEPLAPPAPPVSFSELRPQQSRNGVWRWQLRRRRRSG
jgi:hypothetical protein